MSTTPDLSDLMGPHQQALKEAFERGVVAGQETMLDELAEFLRLRRTREAAATEDDDAQGPERLSTGEAIRAPRGLLDQMLDIALAARPGMTTQETEEAVVALDRRIAVKSVYNRLRHFEKKGQRFKRRDGRWYRTTDFPPPWALSSPQGETGGVAPPASINGSERLGREPDGLGGGT